jgi:EpsI family protein
MGAGIQKGDIAVIVMDIAQTPTVKPVSTDLFGVDRRSLLFGGILAAGAGYSVVRKAVPEAKRIPQKRFDEIVPAEVGPWHSRKSAELVLPPEDATSEVLYENLQTRIYEGDRLPSFMALFGYSSVQQNDVQVHRPEVCYPASGFPIIHNTPVELNIGGQRIYARYLVADRKSAHEYILYWIRLGKDFPTNWSQQRLDMAYYNISGVVPDGFLYRSSTIDLPGKDLRGPLEEFSRILCVSANPSFKKLVI